MRVWRSISTDVAVVSPLGELDLSTCDALREALQEASTGSRLVLVDLADVTFLDSMTIGVLIAASKRCSTAGQEFQVINAWGICLKVLRLTGLSRLMGEEPALPMPRKHLTS